MLKRTYKVRITKENISRLKNELKDDESIESIVRSTKSASNQLIQDIRVTVKLISQNKSKLVEEIIIAHDGAIIGNPDDRGEFDEHPSKWNVIKNNIPSIIFIWIGLMSVSLFSNIDELNELILYGKGDIFKFILIPILTIVIAFALTFGKKLRINLSSE